MKYDIVTENLDNKLGTDGNYVKTETSIGMIIRCITAHYGKWPVGNELNVDFGNSMYESTKNVWSDSNKKIIKTKILESLTPLIKMKKIKNVSVEELPTTRDDAPRLRIIAFDISQQDTITLDVPWGY